MKLKPFRELIALSKEKLDEVMAPVREHKAKSKAQFEMAKIDEQVVTLEAEVQEMCTQKDIDFEGLIAKMDKVALLERKKKQYVKVIGDLFP